MKKQKNVREFMFKLAEYYVSDENGDKVILRVDYKDNGYAIEASGKALRPAFEREIHRIAADLLRRKRGVDFANRVAS